MDLLVHSAAMGCVLEGKDVVLLRPFHVRQTAESVLVGMMGVIHTNPSSTARKIVDCLPAEMGSVTSPWASPAGIAVSLELTAQIINAQQIAEAVAIQLSLGLERAATGGRPVLLVIWTAAHNAETVFVRTP